MRLVAETFCIYLVNILGAGRSGRKPAAFRYDLEAADLRSVAGRLRQFRRDRLAGEGGCAHCLRPIFFATRSISADETNVFPTSARAGQPRSVNRYWMATAR